LSDCISTNDPGKNPKVSSCEATGFLPFLISCPIKGVIFFLFLSLAGLTRGQDSLIYQRITIRDTSLKVQQVFGLITKATGLSFSYNPEIIDLERNIRVAANQESLHATLDSVLEDPSLEYRIIGHQIVIFRPVVIKRSGAEASYGKDRLSVLEIKGRILDIQNRQPISFAGISLLDKSEGTVANLQGDFLLKIDSHHLQDSLAVACMGYETLVLPVSDIVTRPQDYYLKPDIIPIQEVIIRKINSMSLLRNALANIPKNYPVHPVLLTSFYREIITKGNQVMAVSEAILQTYKTAYNLSVGGDQIKIVKGRKTADNSHSDTLVLKLKAGLNATLLLDVVKNTPDFLTEENFSSYSYNMTDIIVNGQNESYVISFSPKEGYPESFYRGRIFLDIKSMAITAVEFEVDPEKMEEATGMFVLKKPRDIRVKPQKAQYRVTFSKTGDRYLLNLIRCETAFRIRHKNQLFGSVYSTILEMAVTRAETEDIERFRIKETARSQEIFMEQITDFRDSFWGEYNYIKPEEPLEEAIKKLSREYE
jgi:hypothetical protein